MHVGVFLIQSASFIHLVRLCASLSTTATAGTQTRASRVRESSITHKSAITDHAVEENHDIDWHKAKVVDREA